MKNISWSKFGVSLMAIALLLVSGSFYGMTLSYRQLVETPKVEIPEIRLEKMQSIELIATGYAVGHPYNNIAKSGVPAIGLGFMRMDGINFFTVAVDTKVIPLGSLLYIEGIGMAWASDTGPAIQGLKIDLCFMNTDQAMKFGKRKVKVFILEKSASDQDILSGNF